jgi:FixJ family two-component response regulator
MESAAIVVVVDDDASFRRSTERLLRSAGFNVISYSSAAEFLARGRPTGPACLLLDLQMPGMSGFEMQRELRATGWQIPTIFLTACSDLPTAVRAIKGGAVEFLTKPVNEERLFHVLREALERDRVMQDEQARWLEARANYISLTPRERYLMTCLIAGMRNAQIAVELGISEEMVESHRSDLMRKMDMTSVTELVHYAELLGFVG